MKEMTVKMLKKLKKEAVDPEESQAKKQSFLKIVRRMSWLVCRGQVETFTEQDLTNLLRLLGV